ncbi:hypothetical protein ASG57_25155 [Bradyrhizobium sp. Leaf396]|nr:hypothetical protein ASG57_25155 [Bradyrhizobium sp. Leaf396]
MLILQFSLECLVENGGEQGIQFDGRLGLKCFHRVELGLKSFELRGNLVLSVALRQRNKHSLHAVC